MRLKAIIFLAVLSIGILPLITLVAINLRGHIQRHENAAQKDILARAVLNKQHLARELLWIKKSLKYAANLPSTTSLFKKHPNIEERRSGINLLNSLAEQIDAVQHFALIDPGGHILEMDGAGEYALKSPAGTSILQDPNFPAPGQVFLSLINEFPADTTSQSRQLLLAARVTDGESPLPLGGLVFIVDLKNLFKNYQDAYWLDGKGNNLKETGPENQAHNLMDDSAKTSKPFPELVERFAAKTPFLSRHNQDFISWFPLSLANGESETVFWIGNKIDMSNAEAWKRSLITNIAVILTVLAALVFVIAEFIANRIDSLKNELISGLKGVLEREERISFDWHGPSELQTLAKDLGSLADRYLETRTTSRKAELELRESEDKFRKLTSSAQDGIIMMDNEGRVAYWNKAAENIFGYSEGEAGGKAIHTLLDLKRPEFGDELSGGPETAGRKLAKTKNEIIEIQARHKNGQTLMIELSLSAARIKDQWHAIWIVRDITERKKAEAIARMRQQQLIQADKMRSLGLLVSGVAHEINNPNSIALLNTPMLSKAWKSLEPIADEYYAENGDFLVAGLPYSEMKEQIPSLFVELEESARRIRNIVKDLKDYSRQDTAQHSEEIMINDIVNAAVRLTHNQLKKATDAFTTALAEGLPAIKGNRQRLEQVVINLLQNACEAVNDKTRAISVRTYQEETMICLEVSDQGPGMSREVISQVTDPFFTTKRSQGGTGLGLSVSAGIVKEHHGSIDFISEPLQGTTAVVRLPMVEHSSNGQS